MSETVAETKSKHAKPRKVSRLELHVTHTCNLACESCSHYSNHLHQGRLSLDEADAWMNQWSARVRAGRVQLLGGEPTIHPELTKFIPLVRRHWPRANICIVTNGFFLHRHPDLPRTIAEDGNTYIRMSVHHNDPHYVAHLKPAFDLLETWQREFGVRYETTRSYAEWTRRYHGFGASMEPFEDNDPRASWDICPAKHCKQLYQGKLWKCAPLAYLHLQKEKYPLSAKWDPYLRYAPLDADCSDEELDSFLALEAEDACAMCSAKERRFKLPIPVRNPKALTQPSVQAEPAAR